MEYINAQPAGIRMGQGMQRVYNSHSPFRTVATLAAVAGYIGVEGGGASHAGGTASIRSTPGVTIPAFNYDEWANTGANEVNMVKSSTHLRPDHHQAALSASTSCGSRTRTSST